MSETCPDCGAMFSGYSGPRGGWFWARCGRRWHRKHGWDDYRPPTCLSRELSEQGQTIAELEKENAALRRAKEPTP